jgi:hypothetical protein
MAKVYIVQPSDKFDYSQAEQFGEVVYILPAGLPIRYDDVRYIVDIISAALKNATFEDYLVLSGPNYLLFGMVMAELANVTGGAFKALRYEPNSKEYSEMEIDLG